MTREEIVSGNRLIAEFMGIPKCGRCKDCGGYQYSPAIIYKPEDMRYNESLDWMMPVLSKIEGMGFKTRICFDDFGQWAQIHYGISVADSCTTKALSVGGSKVDNVFSVIVEFIKWHNERIQGHQAGVIK